MFDNFPVDHLRKGVELVAGTKETEASGGITLQTVKDIAETGVDFISTGAITHSAPALDISMDIMIGA
jgi:nicotinate-nucleotide pyrophosphorylase (carboxylating)